MKTQNRTIPVFNPLMIFFKYKIIGENERLRRVVKEKEKLQGEVERLKHYEEENKQLKLEVKY